MSQAVKPPPERPDATSPIELGVALAERYLAYALSTITSRSLPDVRDGLKPVQRRLLYAMRELRLDPASGYKKCARVVGDVIGKFHPHGDVAVYDALVRLAQDFAQRYPLVDGQGNYGNVDGDNPAAMRYTEARLTPIAMALLEGTDQATVDFRPTYDASELEPVVLPAALPNLLANGATGIAVGMATAIPPHNLGELIDALAWLLQRPEDAAPAEAADLLRHVLGPDLPTGGVLVEDAATIEAAYRTGRGSLRLRARWVREEMPLGLYQLIVTEIPFQVAKSRLVERLADIVTERKHPLLADIRDESAETVRIVLVPRTRTVPEAALIEPLFRLSDLETRLPINLNVLNRDGVPGVMGLPALLDAFIEHRLEVIVRRSNHRLAQVANRLELLEGYLRVFLDIDRVIAIIREEDEPRPVLMRQLDLSERQAEAVLNLRLRSLRRLEEEGLRSEAATLRAEAAELELLVGDRGRRRARVRKDLLDAKRKLAGGAAGARRTTIAGAPDPLTVVQDVPAERWQATVVLSEQAWVRAIRGQADPATLRFKDGDGPRLMLPALSTDRLLAIAGDGRVFTLAIDRLPGGRGMGEPLSVAIDLPQAVPVLALRVHRPGGRLLLVGERGRGFVAEEAALLAQTRAGRQVVTLDEGERLLAAVPVLGDLVAVLGANRKLLVFPIAELPVLGRGRGVALMQLRDAAIVAVTTFNEAEGLFVGLRDAPRSLKDLLPHRGKRNTQGRQLPRGFPPEPLLWGGAEIAPRAADGTGG